LLRIVRADYRRLVKNDAMRGAALDGLRYGLSPPGRLL